MSCYCGVATKAGALRWTFFFLFLGLGWACFILIVLTEGEVCEVIPHAQGVLPPCPMLDIHKTFICCIFPSTNFARELRQFSGPKPVVGSARRPLQELPGALIARMPTEKAKVVSIYVLLRDIDLLEHRRNVAWSSQHHVRLAECQQHPYAREDCKVVINELQKCIRAIAPTLQKYFLAWMLSWFIASVILCAMCCCSIPPQVRYTLMIPMFVSACLLAVHLLLARATTTDLLNLTTSYGE